MKSGWKDFFYFQQNDKRAILLLLILIVGCVIAILLSDKIISGKEIALQQESLDEFENFQNSLTDKKTISPVSSQDPLPENKKSIASGKLSEGEKIDLNSADIQTIKRIPGIGDSFAKRIYDYHNQLGGFVSPEQLMEIEGISPKRYEKIVPYVELKKKHRKLKVNGLTAPQLASHPYITDNQAQSIVALREEKRLMQMKDLSALKDFSPRDVDRLSPYVSFD